MSFKYNVSADDRPFNMAVLFLTRLDKRLDERDTDSRNGNLIAWYRALRIIYRNIFFKIKEEGHEEKEKELNKLFSRAGNFLSAEAVGNKAAVLEMENIAITETEKLLDQIDLILNTLMYEYGLIFPRKAKQNLKEALEDHFND